MWRIDSVMISGALDFKFELLDDVLVFSFFRCALNRGDTYAFTSTYTKQLDYQPFFVGYWSWSMRNSDHECIEKNGAWLNRYATKPSGSRVHFWRSSGLTVRRAKNIFLSLFVRTFERWTLMVFYRKPKYLDILAHMQLLQHDKIVAFSYRNRVI